MKLKLKKNGHLEEVTICRIYGGTCLERVAVGLFGANTDRTFDG
jgi:hypothetical protein